MRQIYWGALTTVITLGAVGCAGTMNATRALDTAAPVVRVYSAGSLREALSEIAIAHEARTGQKIELTFGASGLLRERIERGEPAQVFASGPS